LGDSAVSDDGTTVTVNSRDLVQQQALVLNGAISAAISADQNDYAPTGFATCSLLRLSTNNLTTRHITGLAGGVEGRIVFIENVGTSGQGYIVLDADSLSSSDGNQFSFDFQQFPIPPGVVSGRLVGLRYDSTLGSAGAWQVFSVPFPFLIPSPYNQFYNLPALVGETLAGLGTAQTWTAAQTINANLLLGNKITRYNAINTAGWGVAVIQKAARALAQTAAVTTLATYTPTADGSFEVSANVLVTTSTAHNFTVTVAYQDDRGTNRVLTLSFSNLAGTFLTAITNVTGAGPYEGVPLHIRVKANQAITIATTGTFTTVTYDVETILKQTA
jgi:hypothetical protein